jgi:HK97 family phage prohead protease
MDKRNIQADIEVRAAEGGMEFVISTASVDRHGTVINPNGWELDSFRANPIMAFQHNTGSTDPDDILGTWDIRMERDADGRNLLVGKPNFEDAELNPKADKIRRKIEAGTLRAVSVGFIPMEYHWGERKAGEDEEVLYLDRNALLEVSIVAVPSNPEALKRNAEELMERYQKPRKPKKEDEIEGLKKKGLGIEKARLIVNTNKAKQ